MGGGKIIIIIIKSVYFDLSERDRETWWGSDAREIKEREKKKKKKGTRCFESEEKQQNVEEKNLECEALKFLRYISMTQYCWKVIIAWQLLIHCMLATPPLPFYILPPVSFIHDISAASHDFTPTHCSS